VKLNVQQMPRALRILILTVAIVATLGLSVASAAHVDTSPNGCNICFVAHTVAFETPAVQLLCGPQIVGLATLVTPVFGYRACASKHSCSRGPPAIFPVVAA
jgi:hypothetical protein